MADKWDMNEIVEEIKARGIAAEFWHTGGGCYTIYAGERNGDFFQAAVGPGAEEKDGFYIYRGDACAGPDDGGEHNPVYFTEEHTIKDIVDVVERTVKGEMTFPLWEQGVPAPTYVRPE